MIVSQEEKKIRSYIHPNFISSLFNFTALLLSFRVDRFSPLFFIFSFHRRKQQPKPTAEKTFRAFEKNWEIKLTWCLTGLTGLEIDFLPVFGMRVCAFAIHDQDASVHFAKRVQSICLLACISHTWLGCLCEFDIHDLDACAHLPYMLRMRHCISSRRSNQFACQVCPSG